MQILLAAAMSFAPSVTRMPRWHQASQPSATALARMMADARFRRATSFIGGDSVTEREIANVLGRWKDTAEWNDIGAAVDLDRMIAAGERSKNSSQSFADRSSKTVDQERTPERRKMLSKMGQVQRFLFVDNVPTLPFQDAALASSVGASAAELNAEPVRPLALQIVFDGLTASKSSFANATEANARRASYQLPDGGLDAAALQADLAKARLNIFAFASVFYGTQAALLFAVAYKRGALDGLLDAAVGLGASGGASGGALGGEWADAWANVWSSPEGSALLWAGLSAPLLGRTSDDVLVPNLQGFGAYAGGFAALFVLFRSRILSGRDAAASPLDRWFRDK